jgi:hypothetical protein
MNSFHFLLPHTVGVLLLPRVDILFQRRSMHIHLMKPPVTMSPKCEMDIPLCQKICLKEKKTVPVVPVNDQALAKIARWKQRMIRGGNLSCNLDQWCISLWDEVSIFHKRVLIVGSKRSCRCCDFAVEGSRCDGLPLLL